MIEMLLPYLDADSRRMFGACHKLQGMRDRLYADADRVYQTCSAMGGDWRRNLLMSIRPHMKPERQTRIDTLLFVLLMLENGEESACL